VLLCFDTVLTHPPSCPAFSRMGFAIPPSHGPCTGPPRYYAGSDSCSASPTQQVSPVHSIAFPTSCPQPRHVARRHVPITSCRRSTFSVRLRLEWAGSSLHTAETGSSSYGLSVRLQLLPTPPRGDAIALGYMCGDFTW